MNYDSSITIVDCILKLRALGCKESVSNITDTLQSKCLYNYNNTCLIYDPYGLLE